MVSCLHRNSIACQGVLCIVLGLIAVGCSLWHAHLVVAAAFGPCRAQGTGVVCAVKNTCCSVLTLRPSDLAFV